MDSMLTEAVIRKYISPEALDNILKENPDAMKVLIEPPPFDGKTAEEIHKELIEGDQPTMKYAEKLDTVARLASMLLPNHFTDATNFEAELRNHVRTELTSFLTEMFLQIENMRKEDEAHANSELVYTKINANLKFANAMNVAKELRLKKKFDAIDAEYEPKLKQAKKERGCAKCAKKAKKICCFYAAYCTKKCQKSHWVNHVLDCCRAKMKNANGGAEGSENGANGDDTIVGESTVAEGENSAVDDDVAAMVDATDEVAVDSEPKETADNGKDAAADQDNIDEAGETGVAAGDEPEDIAME